MNIRHTLLLTNDRHFEEVLTEALAEVGSATRVTKNVGEALEIGCRPEAEFDLVVIDRSDCHAITLLCALKTCRPGLPIIVVTSSDPCHCAALAYANGATACLAKPITATELSLAIHELREPQLQLTAA
jgi:DNA-binding NtrC family response regulator